MRPDPRTDFPAFYQQHGDRIYRFCYRLSGSTADAEDLTQEVFLAAFQGAGRFAGRASVQTWLYRIALNCWRQTRRAPRLDMMPLLDNAAHPGSLEQSVTDAASLTCALSALPARSLPARQGGGPDPPRGRASARRSARDRAIPGASSRPPPARPADRGRKRP